MNQPTLYLYCESTSYKLEEARIYRMDLEFLVGNEFCPDVSYINPEIEIPSKLIESRNLLLKQAEIKTSPTFKEYSVVLIEHLRRVSVLCGFNILETCRLIKQEMERCEVDFEFNLGIYTLIDPLLIYKEANKNLSDLYRLYTGQEFDFENHVTACRTLYEAQQGIHTRFFEQNLDDIQIATIGDLRLSGKWFYIRTIKEGDFVYFKSGKYKGQRVGSDKEHYKYLTWIAGLADSSKDEKEFIKEMMEAKQ